MSTSDLLRAGQEARTLYKELEAFKDDSEFKRSGFAIGGKYNQWLKRVEALSDRTGMEFLAKYEFVPGDLSILGFNYVFGDYNTPATKRIRDKIERGLPTAAPTRAPLPTPATVATVMPGKGLGVSRIDIQDPFERAGLEFHSNSFLTEQNVVVPVWTGYSEDVLNMELIGKASELTEVTMTVALPLTTDSAVMIGKLFELAAGWNDGLAWITDNASRLANGQKVVTTRGALRIEAGEFTALDWLLISIR